MVSPINTENRFLHHTTGICQIIQVVWARNKMLMGNCNAIVGVLKRVICVQPWEPTQNKTGWLAVLIKPVSATTWMIPGCPYNTFAL